MRRMLRGLALCVLLCLLWWSCRGWSTNPKPEGDAGGRPEEPVVQEQASQPEQVASLGHPVVLLISLDGFRWDYMDQADTPNLDRLVQGGVKAESLIPVFPSKTFPNHYSIVTGLYSENHGIVSNSMFDPVFREFFRITDAKATTDGKWWEGEPIWVTASKQGVRSGTMFWPGSDAAIQGIRPTYWQSYDGRLTHAERVKQIITWLTLPADKRPSFLTLYLEDVDGAGHKSGPTSLDVWRAVERVDQTLGLLIKELEQRNLFQQVNLVVVSDHGMAALSSERRIFLTDYIDLNDTYINELSMVLALNPKEGKLETVYNQLKDKHPHLKVYKKAEVPAHLHYRKHRRIAEIIGIADEGWVVVLDRNQTSLYAGSHGYDPKIRSMHGIFVAHGPAFKQGHTVPPFENIHIYALLCHILKLKPAPHDGNLNTTQGMLRSF